MSRQEIAQFTHATKYAHYLPELRRRETIKESGDRMFNMHRRRFPELEAHIDFAHNAFDDGLILASQRVMQFGGIGVERNHARGYNCSFSYADRLDVFHESFWLLLCGTGTGISIQQHHVAKIEPMRRANPHAVVEHVAEDSIEGWADCLKALMWNRAAGFRTTFDLSAIRPKGSPISTSNGLAPGPEPLREALNQVQNYLDEVIGDKETHRLTPIEVADIILIMAGAVMAGGVRRSAIIFLFSPEDQEMMQAKTGRWFEKYPWRGRSNNSAVLLRNETSFETFAEIIKHAREFGEPGFYFSDSTEFGTNPCAEIGLDPRDEITGRTGWAFCNLSTVVVSSCETKEDFFRACKAASIIGTIQAAFTDFPYLGAPTENIARRDALLGVSMTGMCAKPHLAFDEETLRTGVEVIRKANEKVAGLLGINTAARLTCVKPEGTGSLLFGTSSGIHPFHADRYIRRIQTAKNDPVTAFLAEHNPVCVSPSAWGKDDVVISFPCEAPENAETRENVDALQMLERVALVQRAWVVPGTNRGELTHNVSNTVTVQEHEWDDVARYLYENRSSFAGVSLLGFEGDLKYLQPPFTAVPKHVFATDEEMREVKDLLTRGDSVWFPPEGTPENVVMIARSLVTVAEYDKLVKEWKPVNFAHMHEEHDSTSVGSDVACAGGACEIVRV